MDNVVDLKMKLSRTIIKMSNSLQIQRQANIFLSSKFSSQDVILKSEKLSNKTDDNLASLVIDTFLFSKRISLSRKQCYMSTINEHVIQTHRFLLKTIVNDKYCSCFYSRYASCTGKMLVVVVDSS